METFFKVLVNGHSFYGGNFQWSLPRQNADGSWQAGDWHEHKGDLKMGKEGFHLTRKPGKWMKGDESLGCYSTFECYATECEGVLEKNGKMLVHEGETIVCRRVRLTRKLTDLELATYNVFRSAELIPRQVSGDVDLKGTGITDLPDGLQVSGDLDLTCTGITDLPDGLRVGGSLYLRYNIIRVLPEGLHVGGDLDLRETGITVLPEGLYVGGHLNLSYNGIRVLPRGLQVGGDLDLRVTGITVLPAGLRVGGCVYLNELYGYQKMRVTPDSHEPRWRIGRPFGVGHLAKEQSPLGLDEERYRIGSVLCFEREGKVWHIGEEKDCRICHPRTTSPG